MKEYERRRWGMTRERGLLRYLLSFGLAKVGLVFWATFSVFDYLTRYGPERIEPFPRAVVEHFVAWLPGSLVVGLIFATLHWFIMDTSYKNSA